MAKQHPELFTKFYGMTTSKEILFISNYPDESNKKDGMMQRIAAIDEAMQECKRTYLNISIKKNIHQRIIAEDNTSILHLNLFCHFPVIALRIIRAKHIYVHSIYNAIKILPFYFIKKITTDMHGIVPEELKYEKKYTWSFIFNIAEFIAVKFSKTVIFVTNSMERHYLLKHKRKNTSDIVIPIINRSIINAIQSEEEATLRREDLVIYSGGIQKWQNIEKMLSAVKKKSDIQYLFLTANTKELKLTAEQNGIANLSITTARPEEIPDFYKKGSFGFLLRDDIKLNNVACPTKAVEYMAHGIIPIVLCEEIGDFKELDYKYIRINDFIHSKLPSKEETTLMRRQNISVVKKLILQMDTGIKILKQNFL